MGSTSLRPNAAGTTTAQTKSGTGGANYDRVADDSDTTYCSNGLTVNSYVLDTYNIATPTIPGGATIDSVQVKIRFGGAASRTTYFKPAIYVVDTTYYGAEQTRTDATIVEYTETWLVNPADSGAWETADLINLEVGDAVKGSAITAAKCYEVTVIFNYTEAPTSSWAGTWGG